MKKKTIMLWLLCLFTGMPMGVTARTMTYSLSFASSDFQMQRVYNYDTTAAIYVVKSSRYQLYSNNDPTQPELPVIYVTLLLPKDASYAGFSYEKSNSLFKNYLLTVGSEPQVIGFRNNRSTNGWYPYGTYDSSIEFAGTTTVSGYRMVSFKVMPIRYRYTRSGNSSLKLSYVSSFELTIDLNDADEIPLRTSTRGERERSYVENKIWNPEALNGYEIYPSASQTPDRYGAVPRDRYIIITNNSLKDAFQPLAAWKNLKGLETSIVTKEEIYANTTFSADTGIQKIKHYLKNEFESTNVKDSIEFYVLMGGDVDIIPTAYCYPQSEKERDLPCDMYYACVSDNAHWTWDNDHDGILADDSDDANLFADLYVARASVQTPEEVSTFVRKVIQYETNPPVNSDWGNKTLFIGERLKDPYYYSEFPHDVELFGRAIIEASLDSVKQSGAKYLFSSASNLYADPIYDNVHDITTYIDSLRYATQLGGNYSVINQISHGSHSAWGCFKYIPNTTQEDFYYTFDRNSANSIVSTYPKVIISAACQTNEFDIEYDDYSEEEGVPCLSECLMRNPNSGVVAYVGSSVYGYFSKYAYYTGNYFTNSIKVNKLFMDALYNPETDSCLSIKQLGKVVDYAKKGLSRDLDDRGERSILFSINTLGDPEMPLYTTVPQQFENVTCHYENDSLFITMDSTVTAYVQFSGDSENKLYKIRGDYSDLVISSDSIIVTLLKQNYIPKVFILYNTDYIQNHTFNQNYTDDGYYQFIHVGRNVTDKKPVGNVTVGSGKIVTLKAQKGVYIKNGFTNPLGSTFEIDIDRAE